MSIDPHAVPPQILVGVEPTGPQGAAQSAAPPAVVAQLLATEHWSLLATRGMLWSELMSRISIQLTVSSAALVVLALVAQATGFGSGFWIMAIGLSSAMLVLGTLTLLRVTIGSLEDHRLVVGMNRLRGAYGELAPEVLDSFVTSPQDDSAGVVLTYTLGARRPLVLHAISSTTFFLAAFNAMVAGTLVALITFVAGGPTVLVAVLGVLAGAAYLGGHTWLSGGLFRRVLGAGFRENAQRSV
jgi:hypothetical protein